MNSTLIKYGLWIYFLLAATTLPAQDHAFEMPVEKLQLFTDRTLYISGEEILFSAVVINEDEMTFDEYNRILYAELIKPDGTRISGGKYPVENSSVKGCLIIPEETITGYYYLKSYTKWMRNGSQYNYSFTRMKIINPYTAEMQEGVDFTGNSAFIVAESKEINTDQLFRFSADKLVYQPREQVKLSIEGYTKHDSESKWCLAVVPEAAFDNGCMIKNNQDKADTITAKFQYYPETRGISLSGRLLEDESENPVPNALVNLSIIGDLDVMAIRTDASGKFYFALPDYTGNRDIFLCSEDFPGKPTGIYIDNDFCSRPVDLPSPVINFTEEEKATALNMAVNHKLSSVFFKDTIQENPEVRHDELPFYGKPDEILVMDKYIDLPDVEEYFSELVGSVNVRKFEGRKVFRFNSFRTEMTIYDPLVLIDWVAVNDIDKILAMSPRLIERIELVNAPYIKGNITYGGIISFISKNSDFAGIDLPSSGTFVNYRFLEKCPENMMKGPLLKTVPDSRNTVYWDPDLKLNDSGATGVQFTTPDTPGKYLVVLRGTGNSGDDFIIMEKFEVKIQ
jgi:hypothetical protein